MSLLIFHSTSFTAKPSNSSIYRSVEFLFICTKALLSHYGAVYDVLFLMEHEHKLCHSPSYYRYW